MIIFSKFTKMSNCLWKIKNLEMIFSIVWIQVNWTNISKVWWMDWLQKYFVLTMQVIVFKRNWIKERNPINRKFKINLETAHFFYRFVLAILLVRGNIVPIYKSLYKTFLSHFLTHLQGVTCDSVQFQVTPCMWVVSDLW